jgi:hypothetical protein
MHETQRPAEDGPRGPKTRGRPAGPCRPALHPLISVRVYFSLGHGSIYFLSLPTFLATSKLGKTEFSRIRCDALLVASFIRCSS